MEIFIQVKVKITCECRFSGKFAFSVFVIPAHIPHGIAPVKIRSNVIRDICYNKLCFLDRVALPSLHTVVI